MSQIVSVISLLDKHNCQIKANIYLIKIFLSISGGCWHGYDLFKIEGIFGSLEVF